MIIIWGSAIGLSSFQLIHGKAERFEIAGNEFYDCTEVWEEIDGKVKHFNIIGSFFQKRAFSVLSFLIFFLCKNVCFSISLNSSIILPALFKIM